jgi:Holliday junction resolvase RusA-like endonuclease
VSLTFTAYGKPAPGGSKRAFQHPRTNRIMVTDASARSKPWKQEVAAAAAAAMLSQSVTDDGVLVDGPLSVVMTFYVPRPRGHYGTKGLKASAPDYPTSRPDVLKLARAVEDALTGVVYRDDSQIVLETLRKEYGEPARCEVIVRRRLPTPVDAAVDIADELLDRARRV